MNELAAAGIPVAVTCRVLTLARQPYYRWRANSVTDAEVTEAYETPWKSRRLLTLETRMQVCRRNSCRGSPRRV
ncbi:hypothetical protein AAHS21_30055, partial [Mycobacterium sp. 050272]